MAIWVTNTKRRREIDEYFSSMSPMALRIVEEKAFVRRKYKDIWEDLSVAEQENKINEWFMNPSVKKRYALLPQSSEENEGGYNSIFPSLNMDTGQKIVELRVADTKQNEINITWKDEHSEPFSWETKSQMNLRLPTIAEALISQKTGSSSASSSLEKKPQKPSGNIGQEISETLGDFVVRSQPKSMKLGDEISRGHKEAEEKQILKENNNSIIAPSYGDSNVVRKFTLDLDDFTLSFDNDGKKILSEQENKDFDSEEDLPVFNNETELKTYDVIKHTTQNENIDPTPVDLNSNSVHKTSLLQQGSEATPVTYELNKMGHKRSSNRKLSKSSNRFNPRSSLTLDADERESLLCNEPDAGAIHNLEVAMRQNSEQEQQTKESKDSITTVKIVNPDSPVIDLKKTENITFKDDTFLKPEPREGSPLLSSISLGLDETIPVCSLLSKIKTVKSLPILWKSHINVYGAAQSENSEVHKTGYDFLDNW